MNRSRFTGMKVSVELPPIEVMDLPQWNCGPDVPFTWEPEELKALAFRTIKDNFKRGVISKDTYLGMMQRVRSQE